MSGNRKRRGDEWRLVDINELPALTSLDPDALKNFTKDELRSYLKAYGKKIFYIIICAIYFFR